jgi:hypothetical protein
VTRWTLRFAALLAFALRFAAAEEVAIAIDGGTGASAIAAISSLPHGPRRDLEVALWAERIMDSPGQIAIAIDPAASDSEIEALIQLHHRVMTGRAQS